MRYAEECTESAWTTYQGMITTECQRELAFLCMVSDSSCHGLADTGHKPGVLELANGRVVLAVDLFKLMMTVKLDLPAKLR